MVIVHFIIEIQNFKNFEVRDLNLEVYRKENYRIFILSLNLIYAAPAEMIMCIKWILEHESTTS